MKPIVEARDVYQSGYRWLVVTADGQRVDITDALERNQLAVVEAQRSQVAGFTLLEVRR